MNTDATHFQVPEPADADTAREHDRAELRRLNAELEQQAAHLKELNQALSDREQRLRLAVAAGGVGLWVWNSTDVASAGDWSPRLKEIFGLPLHTEVTHGIFLGCVHPEDRERVDAGVMAALGGVNAGEYACDYRAIRLTDGAVRWVSARGQAFFDEAKVPVRFIGTLIDITERKLAEETATHLNLELDRRITERTAELERANRALEMEIEVRKRAQEAAQRSEDTLRQAIDTIPALAWSALPDGRIEYFNKRWLDYTGMSLAQAQDWGWQTTIHADDLQGLLEYWVSIMAAQRAGEYEARVRRHDSAYRWFLIRGVPLFDATGVLMKWYGTNTDVDDRKQAEEKLRRSERSLAEGQRLTKTGTWVLDFQTGDTNWSLETCRIFGFPPPPPSPHYSEFRARVHPEDREVVDRGLRESFELGEPRPLHYRFILPNGVTKFIETISEPVKDASGAVLRLMGTIMDVTERRLAEEALQSSEILARGQVDALTQTLEALSKESEPEKFLEHVLHRIVRQLDAHGLSVWEMNEGTGRVELVATREAGAMHFATEEERAGSARVMLPVRDHPVWTEFFRHGRECVIGDMEADPPQVRLTGETGWHYWLGDAVENPITISIQKRFKSAGIVATLCIPLFVAAKVTGFISVRFTQKRTFGSAEVGLGRALAHQAMLALQMLRLSQQSRATAVIAERSRMWRDIHDTLAQGFTGVIMQLQAAKGAAAQGSSVDAAAHIDRAEELARASLGEARRSMRALRLSSLSGGSLAMAITDLFKRATDGTALKATLKVEGEPRPLAPEWEEALLRIAQEALTNTLKHARANAFHVTLAFAPDGTRLHLADNGCGFDPQHEHDGLGIIGMRERIDQLSGQFSIRSEPGGATQIIVAIPPTVS